MLGFLLLEVVFGIIIIRKAGDFIVRQIKLALDNILRKYIYTFSIKKYNLDFYSYSIKAIKYLQNIYFSRFLLTLLFKYFKVDFL